MTDPSPPEPGRGNCFSLRPTGPLVPRGPLSKLLLRILRAGQVDASDSRTMGAAIDENNSGDDILDDDDLQLTLFLLYALSYGSLGPAGDALEWNPRLLQLRLALEARHEAGLRARTGVLPHPEPTARQVAAALFELAAADDGPSLAQYVARQATPEQLREVLVLRSIYTLREADPHSWAIPRLTGRAKAALVEIQNDEYGGGRPEAMHSSLYADTMRGAGLSDRELAYLDLVPAVTLASHNTMSLFGLNRRLVGAVVGHLAAFEMTSSLPNRRYRDGFARAGYGEDVTAYFAEHVQADAVHEQVAAHDLAGALAEQEPPRVPDIMFGAAASLAVDGLVARHVLGCWDEGRSALRGDLTSAAP